MDEKGPGAIRGLGSFERGIRPFIDLTSCRRARLVIAYLQYSTGDRG
jgi:hypothetical protein